VGSEILAAVLALIGFVLTQGFLKFVLDPIQEQRQTIGELSHVLSTTLLNVQEDRSDVDKEELIEIRKETRNALRSLAGRLWTSLWSIPFYDAFALVRLVPKADDLERAATKLTISSYFLYSRSDVSEFIEVAGDITEALGITRGMQVTISLHPEEVGESDSEETSAKS
jgi:hypothetical protein